MSVFARAVSEAFARASTTTLRLRALELTHSSMSPIRLTDYDQDISVAGSTYVGNGMRVSESQLDGEPGGTYMVQLDGSAGGLQFYLSQANSTLEPIQATVRAFAYDSGTNQVGEVFSAVDLEVQSMAYQDDGLIALNMGYKAASNLPFPSKKYTPDEYIDLYRQ